MQLRELLKYFIYANLFISVLVNDDESLREYATFKFGN